MSTKSIRHCILGTKLKLFKMNHAADKIVSCCDVLENGVRWLSLSGRALLGQVKLYLVVFYYNKINEKSLTHNEMMGAKLRSAEEPQIIQSNAGKPFFACKNYRKTLGKVMSISRSVIIQYLKEKWVKLGN